MKVDDIDLAFTEDPNAEEDNGSGFYDSITLYDKPTTRYFYDGQMCMQEEITETVNEEAQWTYTRYGLGARGIDYIEKQVNQGSVSVAFPVYDGHGNMVMTLSRSGNGWSDGLHRSYDVWGSLRWNPSNSGDVKQRYCANLGHVEDDASGLIYMRARFHEPWTGRFVSEDILRDGANWFTYVKNDPIGNVDSTGNWDEKDTIALFKVFAGLLGSKIFFCTTIAFLASGLGVLLSPLCWGLSLMVSYVAGAWCYASILDNFEGSKWHPSTKVGPNGGTKYDKGILLEVISFITGWYGLLELLFKHSDSAIEG